MLHCETLRMLVFSSFVNCFKQFESQLTLFVTVVSFFNFLTLIVQFVTIIWVKRFHVEQVVS